MVRTRVGYAGGEKSRPTYRSLGGHTEALQIDYDPAVISYDELLAIFWKSHNPTRRAYSRQYASLIFTHDDEQRRLAVDSKAREAERRGARITTELLPAPTFWLAEDYHQKYSLRHTRPLLDAFQRIYPRGEDFINSTAAARVNGFAGGNGTLALLDTEIDRYGLPPDAQTALRRIAERYLS